MNLTIPALFAATVLAAAVIPVFAQTPPPAAPQPPPEMVLMPRAQVEALLSWVASPDATTAVRLYAAAAGCLASNPQGGVLKRSGPDQCPVVTEALAARDKQIADLTKAHDDAAAKSTAAPAKP